MLAPADEARGLNQNPGTFPEAIQRGNRFCFEISKFFSRLVFAKRGHQRRLARMTVLAGLFSELRGISRHIEQIISKLKCTAERAPVFFQSRPVLPFRTSENSPRGTGVLNESARLERLHVPDFVDREFSTFRVEIERLTTSHSGPARGARKTQRKFSTNRCVGMRSRRSENFECERQQRVTSEDRGRLVKLKMHGGTAAPEIIVIHGRQIVMNQRVTVDTLKSCSSIKHVFAPYSEQCCGFDQQKGAQTLPASKGRILHGLGKPRRWGSGTARARQQICEPLFDLSGRFRHSFFERHANNLSHQAAADPRVFAADRVNVAVGRRIRLKRRP